MFYNAFSGIRRVLEYPIVFKFFQDLVGANAAHRRFVDEYVRPFSGACVFDIGCGPGTLCRFLPEDVRYVGYDFNRRYIAMAQENIGHRGEFFCQHISEGNPHRLAGEFDIVIAAHVLHHLNNNEARDLINSAYLHLKPGGIFVSIDATYITGQSPIARYLISLDRGEHIRTPQGYQDLLFGKFSQSEATFMPNMLRLPWTHFVMRATK